MQIYVLLWGNEDLKEATDIMLGAVPGVAWKEGGLVMGSTGTVERSAEWKGEVSLARRGDLPSLGL